MKYRVFDPPAVAAFLSRSSFVLAALTALVLAGSPSAPAVAGDEAAALIAKHAAYVGWHVGDGVVKTLREAGDTTRDGKTLGTLTSLRYGHAHRDTFVTKDGIHSDSGFTGSVAWTSSENGFTIRPIGEVVRWEFAVDSLFSEATVMPAFTPAIRKNEKVAGVDCVVVRLTSATDATIDVYVDPATGAYLRAVVDPDGKYESSYDGLAYQLVDGKRFLSAWHFGNSKTRHGYATIEVNPQIEPDALRPPKQTATWTFGDAPAQIEYVEAPAKRIYVELVVNGVKGKFILDTGTDGTSVVDSFARRAGAKRFGTTGIGGIGANIVRANLFRVDTIAVGGSVLHDVIISSGLDEQDFERMGVVGIIGFDLFAATVAELNLDTKSLRLMDPAKVAPDERAGMAVRVDLSDFHIRAPMRIDDRLDVIATLDSGSPSLVLISRDLITREHLELKTPSEGYISGIGGDELVRCGHVKSVSLGPFRYEFPRTCASASFARNEILIGLDFMRAFNFVFDYPDGLIVMTPRKHF
ncbi:MAG: aspartate aminotransferase [Candidatus Eremiobacteraeota bacterium]|nr:aspartate aminotransferase [Candidatus Eremiobacteraeota bacterium]